MGTWLSASPARRTIRLALIMGAVLTAAIAGLAAPLLHTSVSWLLVFGTIFILVVSLLVLSHRMPVNLLDPAWLGLVTFSTLFVLRPAYDLYHGRFFWVSVDISDVYTMLLVAIVLAALGFFAGILGPASGAIAARIARPPQMFVLDRMLVLGYVFLGLGILLHLAHVYLVTGNLATLFARRESVIKTGTNVPLLVEGAMIVLPALLVFLHVYRTLPLASMPGILVCGGIVIASAINGDRRYAIVIMAGAVVFYYLSHGRSPRMLTLVAVGLIVFLGLIGPVELTRGNDRTYSEAIALEFQNPTRVAEELLLISQSTSQYSAFGLVLQDMQRPESAGWRYGVSTLTETVLQPIPRILWASKPPAIRQLTIQTRFGFEQGRCVSLCPTFSSMAPFYSDFGFIGIMAGFFFLGVIIRIPWAYFQLHKDNFLAHAAAASFALVPLFGLWGSLGSVTVSLIVYIIPLVVVSKWSAH